jgi:hypothetical protein
LIREQDAEHLSVPAISTGHKAQERERLMTRLKTASLMGSETLAKDQRHMQRHAAVRGERFRNANAALTSGKSDRLNRRAAAPGAVAGNVGGGAAATAGAIATAPFRAFDNSYNNNYGYGYGGRDWKTYARHTLQGPGRQAAPLPVVLPFSAEKRRLEQSPFSW